MSIKKEGWDPKDAVSVSSQFQEITGEQEFEIKCMVCGREHEFGSDKFFSIYGNVLIGINGGIIGNNFSNDGKLARINFICRNEFCLLKALPIKDKRQKGDEPCKSQKQTEGLKSSQEKRMTKQGNLEG